MNTNDRPETLTPAELREQSESWRRAALAWQAWAAVLLAANGAQPKGGERGDEAARAKIEALTRRGRTKPSLALEAAALAYAGAVASRRNEEASLIAAHRARTGHRRGALDTLEAEERLGSHDAAVERARGAMGRAAVALWKAERRRSGGGGRAR
jgi:hypothetical protein